MQSERDRKSDKEEKINHIVNFQNKIAHVYGGSVLTEPKEPALSKYICLRNF